MTKNKIAKYVANTALLTVLAAAGIGAYQLGTAPVKEEKVREEAGTDEETSVNDNGENNGDTAGDNAGSADEESLVDVDTSQVEADMEGTSEDGIAKEESDGGSSQELTDGAAAGEEGWEARAGADAEDNSLNTNFGTDAENNSQETSTGMATEEDGQEASAGATVGDDDLAANAGIDAEKERRGMSTETSASDTDSSTEGSTSESGADAKRNSDGLETSNTGVYADAAGAVSNGLNSADSSSATASIVTSGTNTNIAGAVNGTNTASLPKLSFSADTDMTWPVNGNILLDYNMDQTIYFPTLDQYKLNPAISVQAAEGAPVLASVPGTVYSIEENAQTGTTVTMEIGSGYQAIYGQLKDLEVAEGDTVAEGAVIGYIAAPTKYYSSEGSNLYFAMKENGEPVDPIAYLP